MLIPNLSPAWGAGNYRAPPLSPLVVKTNSTRKTEHTYQCMFIILDIYLNFYQKIIHIILHIYLNFYQKLLFHYDQILPDCLAEGLFVCAALANLWPFQREAKHLTEGLSPDQWWRGTKTHWFAPLPSSTFHRHDFILRLLQCPAGMSFVLVNDHTASRDRNAEPTLSTSACVQVTVPV